MPKFLVHDRMACWVTWSYEIEAKDADEAREIYIDGAHGEPTDESPEIGDCIEYLEQTLEIT